VEKLKSAYDFILGKKNSGKDKRLIKSIYKAVMNFHIGLIFLKGKSYLMKENQGNIDIRLSFYPKTAGVYRDKCYKVHTKSKIRNKKFFLTIIHNSKPKKKLFQ